MITGTSMAGATSTTTHAEGCEWMDSYINRAAAATTISAIHFGVPGGFCAYFGTTYFSTRLQSIVGTENRVVGRRKVPAHKIYMIGQVADSATMANSKRIEQSFYLSGDCRLVSNIHAAQEC